MTKISIIGAGVVGTATGKGFHNLKHEVIFYDISDQRLAALKDEGYQTGSSIDDVISKTEISFVCIGTPTSNGIQDLSQLMMATSSIVKAINKIKRFHLIVFRSTILPGTMTNMIVDYFDKYCTRERGRDYDICYNPEFLRQATPLEDFEKPDRVIIGEYKKGSSRALVKLYEGLTNNIIVTTFEAAEMIKYASNSFLALKISFFNEIGILCKKMNIDDKVVSLGVSLDSRIGKYGVKAGKPFAGACLPKDTEAFANFVKEIGVKSDLLKVTLEINKEVERIFEADAWPGSKRNSAMVKRTKI